MEATATIPAELRITPTVIEIQRFWGNVDKTPTCWLWTLALNSDGYGSVSIQGVQIRAHRLSYLLVRGPVPDGMQLDHLCRVRHCLNPDHLEPVTAKTNLLRGINPWAINKRRTHCVHGHKFTPENTRLRPDGRRQCRACDRGRPRKGRA